MTWIKTHNEARPTALLWTQEKMAHCQGSVIIYKKFFIYTAIIYVKTFKYIGNWKCGFW
jgi:hypothetical protein